MRGFALFLLTAVVVLLIGATVMIYRKYEKATAEFTDSQGKYTEAINAIAEIQDSLYAIAPGDTSLGLAQSLRTEQNLTEPQTQQALEQIAAVKSTIGRTKVRITELEGRLKKNGVKVAGLEKLINSLKQSVAEKEEMVSQLTYRVDSLQTTVSGLETAVQQGQETIRARDQALEERRSELATVYCLVASRKDLKDAGMIQSKGGFLGMGKTVQLTGQYDESRFTPLDTDRETLVRTGTAKARVLSAQPASSYELKLEGEQMELHILNAKEFRKVRHLVIMTG